jgi:hypothetical protein
VFDVPAPPPLVLLDCAGAPACPILVKEGDPPVFPATTPVPPTPATPPPAPPGTPYTPLFEPASPKPPPKVDKKEPKVVLPPTVPTAPSLLIVNCDAPPEPPAPIVTATVAVKSEALN